MPVLKSEFTELESDSELGADDRLLLEKAREASLNAYAPYSEFCVGAALLLENGEIVSGNNQENAAFPSGLCAERVAAFAASAKYPGIAFKSLAVTCRSLHAEMDSPPTPCGACRQVLAEYEQLHEKNMRIILAGTKGKVWIFKSAGELIPLVFDRKKLKKK